MGKSVDHGATALSVVIPVLNDAQRLTRLLQRLQEMPGSLTVNLEVIVVDGGSADNSVAVAQTHGAQLVRSQANRGLQMHEGARLASGRWLWFLHADSSVSSQSLKYLTGLHEPGWGRFDIELDNRSPLLRLVAWFMNQRSRFTGICTGDQGIFVHADLLERVGGVPPQPLMEDIELSKRLKAVSPPLTPAIRLHTSARRWEKGGVVRTVGSMWRLRWRYWRGATPEALAREYYG